MRRTLIGIVAAAAFVPATLGLAGNASFSQSLPAPVPPSGQVITPTHDLGDDHGDRVRTGTPTPAATTRTAEPGDDHGGDRMSTTSEPGDDHRGDRVRTTTQAGDDHGGDRVRTTSEPGDDHGGRSGSGGHGSDDGARHG